MSDSALSYKYINSFQVSADIAIYVKLPFDADPSRKYVGHIVIRRIDENNYIVEAVSTARKVLGSCDLPAEVAERLYHSRALIVQTVGGYPLYYARHLTKMCGHDEAIKALISVGFMSHFFTVNNLELSKKKFKSIWLETYNYVLENIHYEEFDLTENDLKTIVHSEIKAIVEDYKKRKIIKVVAK